MAGAGKVVEPPGKKRKLEHENEENEATAAGLWDDEDDLLLTQDQWQNIDNNVHQYLSQHPQGAKVPNHVNMPKSSSNIGKSPRSLGRGMQKSHSAGSSNALQNSSFAAAQTPTGFVGSTGLQNRFTPYQQRSHGIPSANRVLTPQAGSAPVSPALPTQARCNMPHPSEKLRKELEHYKQEVQSFRTSQYSKDGQITMLKKSLMEKERLLGQLHQDRVHQLEAKAKDQTEKEKGLESEIERFKTQLQFKEHENVELQTTCKRLEAKASSSSSDERASPRKNAPVSPRINRSPRGSSPRASQQSQFPNKKTFMEETKSLERPKRAKLFEETSKLEKAKGSPVATKSTTKPIRKNLLKLAVPGDKGAISGGTLVAKLLAQQKVDGATFSAGLVTLMASSVDNQTESPRSSHAAPSNVPKSSSQPEESCSKPLVKLKDSILINQGVTGLLSSGDDCSPSVLLLPAIEDQLTSYLDLCDSDGQKKSSVVAGSDHSGTLKQNAEKELLVKNIESVHNSLSLLLKIATWCGHSRDALLNNPMNKSYCSLIGVGVRGTPTNAQNSENQESDLQLMLANESLSVRNIVKKNKVLDQLIQLARPNLPNGAAQKMDILHLSLKILGQVAHHASAESLERFSKLFTEDVLTHCLSPEVRKDDNERVLVYIAVLDIVAPLAKYSKVLECMCAKRGDCLLSAIYTAAGHSLKVQGPNRTVLTHKILQFINSVLGLHENGCQILLESECQCAHQVARCVVTILHAELLSYQKRRREEQMTILRQGISCLQTLSMVDRRGAVGVNDDAEIAHLVNSMERLMKDDKSVPELESAALQDLWDFFDVEQSEEEDKMNTS